MTSFSPLELFHPDGRCAHALVLGTNCPAGLQPTGSTTAHCPVDLTIVAPGPPEDATRGWLTAAMQRLKGDLHADGVGYLLIPPRWRWRALRQARRLGLSLEMLVAHVPDWERSTFLVPLTRAPLRYLTSALIAPRWWQRLGLALWLRSPGADRGLPGWLWPSAALVLRHAGARPLYEWLLGEGEAGPSRAIVRLGWRGRDGSTVLYRFDGNEPNPTAVVKVSAVDGQAELHQCEAEALAQLGPAAERAGAQVPRVQHLKQSGGRSLLVESAVRGRLAADVLREAPGEFPAVVGSLAAWLEQWHRATVVRDNLTSAVVQQALLEPAGLLGPVLDGSEVYLDWLQQQCLAVVGQSMPWVAAHNDLTMVNVLLADNRRLGIVDWEAGTGQGWPLADFFYACVDAAMQTGRLAAHADAFTACFTSGGPLRAMTAVWQQRLGAAIALPGALAGLCVHACWLRHAANEHRKGQPPSQRSFLPIVQRLALHVEAAQLERV